MIESKTVAFWRDAAFTQFSTFEYFWLPDSVEYYAC